MKNNDKITLSFGQLKRLIKESKHKFTEAKKAVKYVLCDSTSAGSGFRILKEFTSKESMLKELSKKMSNSDISANEIMELFSNDEIYWIKIDKSMGWDDWKSDFKGKMLQYAKMVDNKQAKFFAISVDDDAIDEYEGLETIGSEDPYYYFEIYDRA